MLDNILIYRILREIDDLHVPVGATQLCKRLNMSQASVGRMLLEMEQRGYLVKVSNKGRVLSSHGVDHLKLHEVQQQQDIMAKDLVSIALDDSKQTLLEIMEIRKLLECYTAAQAPGHATDDDICELENLAYTHRYFLAQGQHADEQDLSFHLCIARISQNQTLSKILGLLLTGNNAYIRFSEASDYDKDQQIKFHFRILAAIKDKDSELASQAMHEHLSQIAQDVMRYGR